MGKNKIINKKNITCFVLTCLVLVYYSVSNAQSVQDIINMSLDELMRIQVSTASKKAELVQEAPGIISIISQMEIKGFAAQNLGEILNHVVSTQFLTANIFTDNVLSLRAQSTTPYDNHVLILINGRPVRDPISGGLNNAIYTSFPVSIIDHIEIIRGPGSVLYGSCAYSGVINIITKVIESEGSSASLELGAGSFGMFSQTLTGIMAKNDMNASVGVKFLTEEGPEYTFADYNGVTSRAKFDRETQSMFYNLNYKGLHINSLYARFQPYSLGGADNDWHDSPHTNNIHTTFFFDLGLNTHFHKRVSSDINATWNNHKWNQVDGVVMQAGALLLEGSVNANPVDNLNFVVGGTFNSDDYRSERFINGKTKTIGLYSQIDYRFWQTIKLIGGLQWNKSEHIEGNFSPRAGLVANFSKNMGLKILYSEAFRQGYPLETAFNHPVFRGNQALKPELIRTAEIQFYCQWEKFQTSLTFFNSVMDDIIIREWHDVPGDTTTGGFLQYNNNNSFTFQGVELETNIKLLYNLQLLFSAIYQENENEYHIKNAALHPNSLVKTGLLFNNSKFNIGLFNYYSGKPTQVSVVNPDVANVNKEPTDYHLLSAKLSFYLDRLFSSLDQNVNLALQADNILDYDIRYPEYTTKGVNSLLPLRGGRSFYSTLTVEF